MQFWVSSSSQGTKGLTVTDNGITGYDSTHNTSLWQLTPSSFLHSGYTQILNFRDGAATKGATYQLTRAYTNAKILAIRVGSDTDGAGGGQTWIIQPVSHITSTTSQINLTWWLNGALNQMTIQFPSTTSFKIVYANYVRFNLGGTTITSSSNSSVFGGGIREIIGYY